MRIARNFVTHPFSALALSLSLGALLHVVPVARSVALAQLSQSWEESLQIESLEFSSGLRILFLHDARLPIVTIEYHILVDDPDRIAARAAIDAMRRQITDTRRGQVGERSAHVGASIFLSTSGFSRWVMLGGTSPSRYLDSLVRILSGLVHTVADNSVYATSIDRILVNQSRSQASSSLESQALRTFYRRVQAARLPPSRVPPLGSATSSLDAEALPERARRWHVSQIAPSNTTIIATGRLDKSELLSAVRRHLGSWLGSKKRHSSGPTEVNEFRSEIAAEMEDTPILGLPSRSAEDVSIVIGSTVAGIRTVDLSALEVLHQVLGGNSGARLETALRTDSGLIYRIRSNYHVENGHGVFYISGTFPSDRALRGVSILIQEVLKIQSELISSRELAAAQTSLTGGVALEVEEPQKLLRRVLRDDRFSRSIGNWTDYENSIHGIGADDIRRVARRFFDPSILSVVVAGDPLMVETINATVKTRLFESVRVPGR